MSLLSPVSTASSSQISPLLSIASYLFSVTYPILVSLPLSIPVSTSFFLPYHLHSISIAKVSIGTQTTFLPVTHEIELLFGSQVSNVRRKRVTTTG